MMYAAIDRLIHKKDEPSYACPHDGVIKRAVGVPQRRFNAQAVGGGHTAAEYNIVSCRVNTFIGQSIGLVWNLYKIFEIDLVSLRLTSVV
jgi:hypothetical protein